MAIESKRVKYTTRQRTKYRIRKRIFGTDERPRLTVFKSARHTYAQVILDITGKTIVSASTVDKDVTAKLATIDGEGFPNDSKSAKGIRAAKAVGLVLAERLKSKSIDKVVFDRNGFIFHGRIKALADGAREGGLNF